MYVASHDLALLQARHLTVPGTAPAGLRLEELHADRLTDVAATYRTLDHRHPAGRLERRFANGLRFGRLWQHDRLVASLWVVHAAHRYIDELNWRLPVAEDQFWVRDVFVAPAARGQRLFSHLLQRVAAEWLPRLDAAWSDVDWDNTASIQAHVAAGFEVKHRVRALDFNGRARWRDALVPWPQAVTDLDAARRWIWLGGERLRRHQAWVA
jgi:GNAT superfamily N-acetyltransferase